MWYLAWQRNWEFSVRQHDGMRFLTRGATPAMVLSLHTGQASSVWVFEKVADRCAVKLTCGADFECVAVDDGCGGRSFCGSGTEGRCSGMNSVTGQHHSCNEL